MNRVAVVSGILFALVLVVGRTDSAPTFAKGISYIKAATISGGALSGPVRIDVSLPEDYGADMWPVDVPYMLLHQTPSGRLRALSDKPRQPDDGEMPYEIVLDYDFSETGHGIRHRAGRFDGVDKLYCPEHMFVGPGIWPAGWYKAAPELGAQLKVVSLSTIQPPNSGDAGLADGNMP